MARSTKRASETDLNALHRLTVKSLVAEMRRLKRAKEPVPAALLTASIKLLTVTDTTTPERPAKRSDRLKDLLQEHEAAERASRGEVDFTLPDGPAREFPEE